jgi:SAM-dependent methyltransferase
MALEELKSTWDSLGSVDPLWAVLTDPGRRNGGWDLGEFMETGRQTVGNAVKTLTEHDVSLGERVLDFGCGVGRLTNALAEHSKTVVGVDLAASMVQRARELNRHPDRVEFVLYDGLTLPFEDGSFDGALSLLVLQHGRPEVQLRCLMELQRVVRPGGVLMLQIPSRPLPPKPLDATAYRAHIDLPDAPASLAAGECATLTVNLVNVSEHTWPASAVIQLGNHWLAGETMLVLNDGRTMLTGDVEPGDFVELPLTVTAPEAAGTYELEVDLVHENVTWWKDAGTETARTAVVVIGVRKELAPAPAPAEDPHPGDAIEMHGLHIEFLRDLFEYGNTDVLAAIQDGSAGEEWENYTYILRRR